MRNIWGSLLCLGIFSCGGNAIDPSTNDIATTQSALTVPNNTNFPNDEGVARTFNTSGPTNMNSIFFQNLGTNGRTCGSCHKIESGWSVNAVTRLGVPNRGVYPARWVPMISTGRGTPRSHKSPYFI